MSPVANREKQAINHLIAHQLYYGKTNDSYLDSWPSNFQSFAFQCKEKNNDDTANGIYNYLSFIGTVISQEAILRFLNSNRSNKGKVIKRVKQILKTIAHQPENTSAYFVFTECDNEWFFLLQIEGSNGISTNQIEIFEELDLPKLYNLPINLPEGYENDSTIKELFNSIETTNENFFITGKAGTGKSTFIHYLCSKSKKKIVKAAYTGIAAVNIGGVTIHSLFNFPFQPLLRNDDSIITFQENTYKRNILQQFDLLVIDEVSMLRSDLLEAIDVSLRRNTGNLEKPFGGKQVILVGDIFQLPPVVDNDAEINPAIFFTEEFASEYFFDAPVFELAKFKTVNLKTVHRQGNEKQFIELLDEVRSCQVTEASLHMINKRHNPNYTSDDQEFILYLTTTNAIAKNINNFRLDKIPTSEYNFLATVIGDFPEEKFPTDPIMKIKKNSQVIFIKNDKGRR